MMDVIQTREFLMPQADSGGFPHLSSCVMALWMAIAGKFCSTNSWANAMHRWTDFTKMITCQQKGNVIVLRSEVIPKIYQLPTHLILVTQKLLNFLESLSCLHVAFNGEHSTHPETICIRILNLITSKSYFFFLIASQPNPYNWNTNPTETANTQNTPIYHRLQITKSAIDFPSYLIEFEHI